MSVRANIAPILFCTNIECLYSYLALFVLYEVQLDNNSQDFASAQTRAHMSCSHALFICSHVRHMSYHT